MFTSFYKQHHEIKAICYFGLGLIITLALVCHQTAHPFMAGALGEYIAASLFYYIGFASYLIPLHFFMSVFIPLRHLDYKLRITMQFLLLISTAVFMTLSLEHWVNENNLLSGGVVGASLAWMMMNQLGYLGATIAMTCIQSSLIILYLDQSLLQVLAYIWKQIKASFQWVVIYIKQSFDYMVSKLKYRFTRQKTERPFKKKKIITQVKAIEPKTVNISNDENELHHTDLLIQKKADEQVLHHEGQLNHQSQEIEKHLSDFGVHCQVVDVRPGPIVTRFELALEAGTKASRITTISKDLARSLSVSRVRVVEVIPGKSVVGLELPNPKREIVRLKEILDSSGYQEAKSPLSVGLGKDIAGHPVVVDLAKMPHLLVAGTTGSGKSVGLNTMILSLICRTKPEDLRMIMIDPKMLELAVYDDIPHLLTPVVTNMNEAGYALRWCVMEMERRYQLMAKAGVRNIANYNAKIAEQKQQMQLLDEVAAEKLPYIVVIADEFADLMMVVGKKVEQLIARIAQKARAAGIHLILATQRPSVDVITGLIKANIPTRIAFQVSSKIDSRTILDQGGAEQLLGNGDMLYLPPGTSIPSRVHGAFVDDDEVHRVVANIKKMQPVEYIDGIISSNEGSEEGGEQGNGEQDPLYDQAVAIVLESKKTSISYLQRRLRVGYNRAALLIESMEKAGLLSAADGNNPREILVKSS